MATGADVLEMLLPNGGWVIYGDDFDSIIYDENVIPITKKAFDEGFAKADEFKEKKELEKQNRKIEILSRLGISEEEARLILSR